MIVTGSRTESWGENYRGWGGGGGGVGGHG